MEEAFQRINYRFFKMHEGRRAAVKALSLRQTLRVYLQGVSSELCLVDCIADKLRGETMDLEDGQAFLRHRVVITSSTGKSCVGDDHRVARARDH